MLLLECPMFWGVVLDWLQWSWDRAPDRLDMVVGRVVVGERIGSFG